MTMQTTQLKVTGMMCEACVGHVKKALEAVPGVQSVAVELAAGGASVRHDGADEQKLLQAVREEGYEAQVA